jgi:hypothetical protein
MRNVAAGICLGLLASVSIVSARTWYVSADGTGDVPTIQAGIDSSAAGDTVLLANGVFRGEGNRDIDFLSKLITVRSESGDPSLCKIHAGGTISDNHRCFIFRGDETESSVLEAITFMGGYVWDPNPVAARRGGGVLCLASSPSIHNCTFSGNFAVEGGGLCCASGAYPAVENCIFDNNTASQKGGGLWLYYSSPEIVEYVFVDNYSEYMGGGVGIYVSAPVFDGCFFSGNIAAQAGGAMYSTWQGEPTIRDCIFQGNRAKAGGAMCLVNVERPGGMIAGSVFDSNHASDYGGAMYWGGHCEPEITGCTFVENSGNGGSVLACDVDASPSLSNCTLYGNVSLTDESTILCRSADCVPDIDCTIISYNVGTSIYCQAPQSPPQVTCSDIFGNT